MNKLIDVDALASVDVLGAQVIGDPNGNSVLVDWQPGNGTRYVVMFTRVDPLQAKMIGCSDRAVLVSLIMDYGNCRAWPFGGGGIAHISYVEEKFAMKYDGDNLAIAALINIALPVCVTDYGIECLDQACGRAA